MAGDVRELRELTRDVREIAGDEREVAGITYLPTYLRMSRSPKMSSPSDLAGLDKVW